MEWVSEEKKMSGFWKKATAVGQTSPQTSIQRHNHPGPPTSTQRSHQISQSLRVFRSDACLDSPAGLIHVLLLLLLLFVVQRVPEAKEKAGVDVDRFFRLDRIQYIAPQCPC